VSRGVFSLTLFSCLHFTETKSRLTKNTTSLPDFTAMSKNVLNTCAVDGAVEVRGWKGKKFEGKFHKFFCCTFFLRSVSTRQTKAICYRYKIPVIKLFPPNYVFESIKFYDLSRTDKSFLFPSINFSFDKRNGNKEKS
jgi:hypothetical protein